MSAHDDVIESAPLSSESTETNGQWFADLTLSTRVQGFALFASLGFFSNSVAWVALGMRLYWKYAVLMSLGNIMSMCSTILLMGPHRQLKSMFDETRRTATTVYISCLFMTLISSFWLRSTALCVMCCVLQYGAFIWYSLSFIPYGRQIVKSFLSTLIGGFFSA